MIRLYLKILLSITVTLSMLTVSARAMGGTQAHNPAIQGFFEGCEGLPQPCWFGVMPGVTTEEEVRELMAFTNRYYGANTLAPGQGYALIFTLSQPWPYCHAIFNIRDGVVVRGEISLCRPPFIRVGDLAAILADSNIIVSLPPEELIYGAVAMNIKGWPALTSRVTYITLLSPTAKYPRYPWHGYVFKKRYCQFVRNYPACRLSG